MMYVIKQFNEFLQGIYGIWSLDKCVGLKDEEYPEFWQHCSKQWYKRLPTDEREHFVKYYIKFIENEQYNRVKDWPDVDDDIRAEWLKYIKKIKDISYWNIKATNKISVPLFKDDTDEEFFNYVVSYMSNKTKLNGAMLSYLYHILSSWFIGKQKEYLSYCKKYNIQFNQIAQRDRHSNLNPSYDSDISVYRRNSFESAQKSWNESNKKQYNFRKEIKAD